MCYQNFFQLLNYAFYFNRFALIYQLTKPVVKKATTQTSTPDSGTKVPAKDTKPSENSSGTG